MKMSPAIIRAFAIISLSLISVPSLLAEKSINVKLGSCSAKLSANSHWQKNADGSYSNQQKLAYLIPRGTSIRIPILSLKPLRVRPNALSFPIDARMLPLPKTGMLKDLGANVQFSSPVSAGIDTGRNIKRKAPNLYLNSRKSYLYFVSEIPFSIDLNKKNKRRNQRIQHKRNKKSKKSLGMQPAFALDVCDPAVFLGGANVTIKVFTVSVNGMGFSYNGNTFFRSNSLVWGGATKRNGQPVLKPYRMRGHMYLDASLSIGLGKFLALTGTVKRVINLDPKRNGLWGIKEIMTFFRTKKLPRTLPDFAFVQEGEMGIGLPLININFGKAVAGINATNPRKIKLQFGGQLGPEFSLKKLFKGKLPPGADLIQLKTTPQIFGNATFDPFADPRRGTYALKVRGKFIVATVNFKGDIDITYRRGKIFICAKLPKLKRLCGKQLGNLAEKAVKVVSAAVVDNALKSKKFFTKSSQSFGKTFDESMKSFGRFVADAAHNFHKPRQCKGEAAAIGQRVGKRLSSKANKYAKIFFANIRPKLKGATPIQRSRAVNSNWKKYLAQIESRRNKIRRRVHGKVAKWNTSAKKIGKYRKAFDRAFDAEYKKLQSNLAAIYRKRENVGL